MLSLLLGRVFNRLIDAQTPPPPPSLFLVKIQRIEQMLFCGLSLVETYAHYVILFWYRKPLLGTGTVRLSQSVDCGTVTS